MANCLMKNLKSCSSIALIGRLNQPSTSFDQKTKAVFPVTKEVSLYDYSLLTEPRLCNQEPTTVKNLQVFSEQWKDINSISHLKSSFTWRYNTYPLRVEDGFVYCVRECKAYKKNKKEIDGPSGRPDRDQLNFVLRTLSEDLPKLFIRPLNVTIYHENIIFENNIKGTKTQGINAYLKEIALLRIIGHIKYANIKFNILKITEHPEDGTVRLRWRISGISNIKAFLSFLRPLGFSAKENSAWWYDGFSIFYVKSDGLVHKHTVDKMMPDNEEKTPTLTDRLAAKVALILGIAINGISGNSVVFEQLLQKNTKFSTFLQPLELFKYFSNRSKICDIKISFSDISNKSSQDN